MKYELYNADCLEKMKDIPDKSIDLILCDLPYGVTYKKLCKWDFKIPFDKLWDNYNRILKEDGVVLLFGVEPFSSQIRFSNIKNYKYDWYWNKEKGTGFQFSHKQPMRQIETISCFYEKSCFYNYQGEKLKKPVTYNYPIVKSGSSFVSNKNINEDGSRIYKTYEYSTKSNLLTFKRDKVKYHPTQKPLKLLEFLIETYTRENETILDNTMGSGSTGVACVNTNRNFIGIEFDNNFFNIAKKRIEDAENEKASELNFGVTA